MPKKIVLMEKHRQDISGYRKSQKLTAKIDSVNCKKLSATISKSTCISRQRKIKEMNISGHYDMKNWGHSGNYRHIDSLADCIGCEIGEKLLKSAPEEEKIYEKCRCCGKTFNLKYKNKKPFTCFACVQKIAKKRAVSHEVNVFLGNEKELPE